MTTTKTTEEESKFLKVARLEGYDGVYFKLNGNDCYSYKELESEVNSKIDQLEKKLNNAIDCLQSVVDDHKAGVDEEGMDFRIAACNQTLLRIRR